MEKITSALEILEELPGLLLADERYKNDFKSFFQSKCPEIYADIESFYANTNCSCKNKVKNYITQHKEKVANCINDFFEARDIKLLSQFIEEIMKQMPVEMSGKILKTTTKNWESFGKAMTKNIFRSFSVVKEGEDLYVFFL